MNEQHHISEEVIEIFRILSTSKQVTQRELSARMGISLGKTNYLLKALIKRGFVSMHNFSHGDNKLSKVRYILTKKGIDQRLTLTKHFLRRKEEEYLRLKKELDILQSQELNSQ